ncbi:MAG: hypothetical protein UV61_C0017G0017 [Candidatus Gottesmanbacteria bacterium GW2011_GWB1_43_11]|uniref:Macro domain-containing protein n=1 Tax=Candidatus Gottesmanbacteria bacterium GW2011_GWB1_43_11 TaxID=1618446 RepID=A0A0G1ER26_9BACT|nr:MAG: hypothetical protein UV04_C0017G0010 [Candidatus Gottesmanbacteria bacterium GW2011_GWA2_42_16]KKS54418.1 MAG: hypothetical protein UV17_C0019G0015 [Candidatus Gottesmanbacteria bacterium GW2011_GWA1_42_26]KKS85506.1 MAG: hypothetical protein UV61_C0017G0017 [Candidatus Gottesmanbacteria bacterium GW2011_GWB1_43_11]OGG10669.1 MAG: hypothetical protein A2699_02600 [Candidatus Gottesmanbacteria bacterium RIFCSPHIGHO2_01_FULL_43_15]OGG27387.1 MAG: hypothetical protein A3A59_06010 [Candidat
MSAKKEAIIIPPDESGNPLHSYAVGTEVTVKEHRAELVVAFGDLLRVPADTFICPTGPTFDYCSGNPTHVAIQAKVGGHTFTQVKQRVAALMESERSVNLQKIGKATRTGLAISTSAGGHDTIRTIVHVNTINPLKSPPCDQNDIRLCTKNALIEADDCGSTYVAMPVLGTELWTMSRA